MRIFNASVLAAAPAAALIVAQPLVSSDVLEPSVQNEVDHAIAVAPTNAVPPAAEIASSAFAKDGPLSTNGLSRTDIAIKLVSAQKADGRWTCGTNDVTAAAVELLKSL